MNLFSSVKKKYRMMKHRLGLNHSRGAARMYAPFQRGDLNYIPADWQIGPPDFVGIASGKAGTSWWYNLLLSHPCVKPNRLKRKELQYFCHFGFGDLNPSAIETYQAAFAAPKDCICGEWSPIYLTFPLAIEYLQKAAPKTKLLAIVRNPVDRVISAMNQIVTHRVPRMHLKPREEYLFKTFSVVPEVFSQSMVSEAFRRLLNSFSKEQLLVLQYEKCNLDPATQIGRTYRFLGLDDSTIPSVLNERINTKPYIVNKLGPSERVAIAEYFREEVQSFVKMFPDIDLSLWPDFYRH